MNLDRKSIFILFFTFLSPFLLPATHILASYPPLLYRLTGTFQPLSFIRMSCPPFKKNTEIMGSYLETNIFFAIVMRAISIKHFEKSDPRGFSICIFLFFHMRGVSSLEA